MTLVITSYSRPGIRGLILGRNLRDGERESPKASAGLHGIHQPIDVHPETARNWLLSAPSPESRDHRTYTPFSDTWICSQILVVSAITAHVEEIFSHPSRSKQSNPFCRFATKQSDFDLHCKKLLTTLSFEVVGPVFCSSVLVQQYTSHYVSTYTQKCLTPLQMSEDSYPGESLSPSKRISRCAMAIRTRLSITLRVLCFSYSAPRSFSRATFAGLPYPTNES